MVHKNRKYRKKVLDYWENDNVESMYDKILLNLEIYEISRKIPKDSKILDAGCGEGEGTLVYSSIEGSLIHAADFSETRLKKLAKRLAGKNNVELKKVDFLGKIDLDFDYDVIISQRFMINLMSWDLQKKVIIELMRRIKPQGRFVMLEGSEKGVQELNELRSFFGLEPIDVKWHNKFFNDEKLIYFMDKHGFEIIEHNGFGIYFLLTRGLRPYFDKDLYWDCEFNKIAAKQELWNHLKLDDARFSRLKLWVFKNSNIT